MAILRDEGMAEDAVQECLLAAIEGADHYAGQATERTWLTGILRHKIVDGIRKRSRETPLEEVELVADSLNAEDDGFDEHGHWAVPFSDWGNPAQALENKRFWEALEACIARMPPRLAQLFMLREVSGMETEIICKEMEISPTNLWTMLYRCRSSLRSCLEKRWVGER